MVYRITKKEVSECAQVFGGGSRYRFALTTKRAGDDSDDGITSDLTVSKDIFDSFNVSDEIQLGFAIKPTTEELSTPDSHE